MKIISQPLFPSVVWTTLLDDHKAFNSQLMNQVSALQDIDPRGVDNTNVKGWQSPNTLQNLPAFEEINRRILQVCQRIGESLHFKSGQAYHLQAWANVSPPGASNKIHYHANCHFSGVYYISLKAPECGSIYFRDPRVASRMMTWPVEQITDFTAEEIPVFFKIVDTFFFTRPVSPH
ncbi:hypothetical protein GCM10011403_19100 [Pseudohongiella nitratireducens]|uniref:Uncharacterized protein n=1 Tax=Pseudohongiella nitratireducens TaxID=1768907 RepID=A0A916VJ28_9GAMM|nr:TIGR02466 family protein [Pseudohongiella nitratireducens]GFZ76154.1 hypothetical protein GCM10011403_19100 [Pseudohongiella nitratireducens]